jgi:hypothetical protein
MTGRPFFRFQHKEQSWQKKFTTSPTPTGISFSLLHCGHCFSPITTALIVGLPYSLPYDRVCCLPTRRQEAQVPNSGRTTGQGPQCDCRAGISGPEMLNRFRCSDDKFPVVGDPSLISCPDGGFRHGARAAGDPLN